MHNLFPPLSAVQHNTLHIKIFRRCIKICGLHQPSLVPTGMPGATVGRAIGAAAVGVRGMGLAASVTSAIVYLRRLQQRRRHDVQICQEALVGIRVLATLVEGGLAMADEYE
jgi:predicted Kef-type K+ transport protein